MRIACLYVPSFPLAAHLRVNPAWRHEALAIADGKGNAARIISLSPRAASLGLSRGLSLPQAKALSPATEIRPRDLEAERAAEQALLETAEAFSPRVEVGGPGLLYLDTLREKNENFLAESLIRHARKLGLFVHVGLSHSKLVARLAAQMEEESTVVEPGTEQRFLELLPLSRLSPSPALADLFHKWGLVTMGALAKLSERDVLVRLGKEGGRLHEEARGLDPQPLVPRAHAPVFDEGVELEWEIGQIEPFLVVARELLERLLTRLELRGLACRRLEINLKLEPQGNQIRTVDLPAPTRDLEALLGLMRLEMESRPPEAPIIAVRLHAEPERPRVTQLSLFGPPALSVDELGTAIARLTALLGPGRVGSPRPVAGSRPEKYLLEPFPLAAAQNNFEPKRRPRRRSPFAAVRVFRPPIPIEVASEQLDHRPERVRATHTHGLPIYGTVQLASGPWRTEDGWWTDDATEREYWDIALSDRSLYRIYYDPTHHTWFADGIYD